MALAVFAVPAMAQACGAEILGMGIFETKDTSLKFPEQESLNFDSLEVGNDNAVAIGGILQGTGPFAGNTAAVTAENNLRIKKNQDSGDVECCQALDPSCPCKDCGTKANVEQIEVGSRNAVAIGLTAQATWPFGRASASTLAQNNVEIVTNQC